MCDVRQIPPFRGFLLLRGSLTTFRRRCGKPTCRCAAGRAATEPGVGVHRGWGDQDPHLADADVPEVVAAFGPFRGCPSRAGACSRRRHGSVARPPGACERPSGDVRRTGAVWVWWRQLADTVLAGGVVGGLSFGASLVTSVTWGCCWPPCWSRPISIRRG